MHETSSKIKSVTPRTHIISLVAALVILSCRISYYEPYFQTAERFYDAGNYVGAIEMYLKAISENNKRAESYYGLALAYDHHGDLEEALYALEKTLELDPRNVLALERLASINLDLGHADSALAAR
jgi:tetratricopeptide (TPR) repeat protein